MLPDPRLTSNSYESGSTEVRLQSYILHVADPDAWHALPAPEYVAFRLASAFFSDPESKEAICASLGWTFPQLDAVLRDNVKFFVRYAQHYAPTIATRRNINDIEVR